MIKRHIGDYHFLADKTTGITMRWGKSVNDNPSFAPVPELADISISNHCTKGCSFCYRNSGNNQEWMSTEDYCHVLDAMNHPKYGNVFQVALGGGEPLEHPEFQTIIDETVKRGIVPNFTTNGIHLTDDICKGIKGKVGAVAISAITVEDIQQEKLALLSKHGIEANVHYVLSSKNIDEAIEIANGKHHEKFREVNAIIFLTYKPAGRAASADVIRKGEKIDRFVQAIGNKNVKRTKIGFDACFVPMLLRNAVVNAALVDSCEGGSFSVYIDHQMNVSPCSFGGGRDAYNLNEYEFYDIWLNKFEVFRQENVNKCVVSDCKAHNLCRGCCPYYPGITVCYEY